jgi:hypothetical protein
MFLDVNQLDEWIQTLTEAKRVGFSLTSSPAELYLELMIDLCTKLSLQFREGSGIWKPEGNVALQFSEKAIDSLGNPKVIRIRTPKEFVQTNPRNSLFFKELAQLLVRFKRGHQQLPQNLYSCETAKDRNQKVQEPVYHYHRRRSFHKKKIRYPR